MRSKSQILLAILWWSVNGMGQWKNGKILDRTLKCRLLSKKNRNELSEYESIFSNNKERSPLLQNGQYGKTQTAAGLYRRLYTAE